MIMLISVNKQNYNYVIKVLTILCLLIKTLLRIYIGCSISKYNMSAKLISYFKYAVTVFFFHVYIIFS